MKTVLVVGVGSEFRGDDGVGPKVAAGFGNDVPGVQVVVAQDPLVLAGRLDEFDEVVFVDACQADAEPGTVLWRSWPDDADAIERAGAYSHSFGLKKLLEMEQALGPLPPVTFLLVVGADFRLGSTMSGAVSHGVDVALEQLRQRLSQGR